MDTGSSATTNAGSRIIARAMLTRCRCPPDSVCGYRVEQVGGRSQSDLLQRLHDPVTPIPGRADAMDDEWLGHDVQHPHVGAEAGVGVLEDGLGAAPEAP